MIMDTPLSIRKISASLPQTVGCRHSKPEKAAFALLSTGSSQNQKLLIKVCLREIVIQRKKTQNLKDRSFKVIM